VIFLGLKYGNPLVFLEILRGLYIVDNYKKTNCKIFCFCFNLNTSEIQKFYSFVSKIKKKRMNLKIKNIGIIEQADIRLDGLTVIAGANDTGKSTIGKLMFAIVKAVSRYEQDLNESKEHNIKRLMEEIYVFSRNLSVHSDKKNYDVFREAFYPQRFYDQIKPHLIGQNNLFGTNEDVINEIFESKINLVKSEGSDSQITRILTKLESLKKYIFVHEDDNIKILRALKRVLFSEFYSEISPKGQTKNSNVELTEGNMSTFSFSVKDNEIDNLKMEDILFFEDVTFIETPIIMQMYEIINAAATLLELSDGDKQDRLSNFSKPKVALHLKDLVTKLENAQFFARNMFESNFQGIKLLETISGIINGGFSFDKQDKDFSFSKNNGEKENYKIKSVNTASGIKSFGIIQLLIQAGVVDSRSLLIIDEPETHLHPQWQVEYARLLVELTKNDISILVTSHSPYLIRALKVFSDKENIADRTAFYLSEKNETGDCSEINDVTNNLNKLFSKLADPLKELL
jgi:predicted ATPase